VETIINLLKKFDFTESEARVYIALLKNGPSTGYEVSKNSSISRSKVYNLLERLIEKGAIICTKNTKPVYYAALPAKELVKNLSSNINDILTDLEAQLSCYNNKITLDYVWYIRGYDNILNKYRNLLMQTQHELYLQIWKEDLDQVYDDIKMLEKKNVKTLIILYSSEHNYDIDLKNYYKHGFEQEKIKDMGGRWITMVSDSKEVLFGYIQNTQNAEVVWTESLPLVTIAKEYVKHDAYCLRLIEALGDAAKRVFGDDLNKIRDVFKKFSGPI
jgi:sugar-specific transcriptional regulator TrmB